MANVKNIELATQNGTERTIYAKWTFSSSHTSEVDYYSCHWYYATGNSTWFEGSQNQANKKNDTYNAPSNAKKVKVKIKAISKTYTSNDEEKTYFTSEWVQSDAFVIGSDLYEVPSVDGVTIDTIAMQNGTDGTVYASWSFSQKSSEVDHYEVNWYYTTGNNTTFDGGSSTATVTNSTWDFPSNANKVQVKVQPIAKSTNTVKGMDYLYWTAPAVKSSWVEVYGGLISIPEVPVVSGVTITDYGVQANTSGGTNYITWSFSQSHVDHYEVHWYYTTSNSITFDGETSTTTLKNSTYSPPSNAKHVKAEITPISTTYTSYGVEYAYWTADAVTSGLITAIGAIPNTPSAPTVEMGTEISGGKYQMKAQVSNINDDAGATDYMQFQFYKGDSLVNTAYAEVKTDRATAYYNVSPGGVYRARCRGINEMLGDSSKWIDNNGDIKITLTDGTTVTVENAVYGYWSDYSEEISPGPDTPTNPTCSAYDKSTIKVTWTKSTGATGYIIQYATDKEFLESSTGDSSTYTVSNDTDIAYIQGLENGKVYYLRIKATNANGESGYTAIVSTPIGTTPEPPTTWSTTTTAIIGATVNLYWCHNCEDGSEQTGARVKLEVNGSEKVISISGDTMSYSLDTSSYDDSTIIYWSVSTKGVIDEYSDYSTVRTITVYSPVTLGINMSATLKSYPLTVELEAGPESQKVVGYYISIIAMGSYETTDNVGRSIRVTKGEEIYSANFNVSTNPLTIEINAFSGIRLESGEEYKLIATVAMNSGLSVETSEYFVVLWDEVDYSPDAAVSVILDSLTASITPICYEDIAIGDDDEIPENTGELVDGITLSVYRRDADGGFTEIATGIPNTGYSTVTDPHPALDYARYRIIAMDDATGAISYEDLAGIPIHEPSIVIQWDEDWISFDYDGEDAMVEKPWSGSLLKLPGNVDVSEDNSPDVNLVEYIGREHPVSYYGTQLGNTATWKTDVPKNDEETIFALRRLARYMGDVYVREPSGTGYWANISVSMSLEHCETVVPVSFNITRVEGGM